MLNGAGVAGVARTTADRLAGQGFTVSQVGDADRPQSQTTLSARPASRSLAESIAQSLGLPTSRVSTSAALPAGVDIQIVVGGDLGVPLTPTGVTKSQGWPGPKLRNCTHPSPSSAQPATMP